MEIILNCDLEYQLKKDFKKFKTLMLDLDEKNIDIFEDEDKAWNLYIMSIVYCNHNLKKCVNKLKSKGIDSKIINKYFYYFIKMKYKMEHKQYSWNEQMEWSLDLEDVEISKNKMSFF